MTETVRKKLPAEGSSHKFTITTKMMRDIGVETPVSGATQLTVARDKNGRLEVFSIGSDGYLYQFRRVDSPGASWRLRRLPWTAQGLVTIAQRDSTDRVFFTDMDGEKERRTHLFELVPTSDTRLTRRRKGCLATTDSRVYGVSDLVGVECDDGSHVVATALAAHPPDAASNWLVVFREGHGMGALSLSETRGVVATRVALCETEPGKARWPEMGLATIYDGRLRVEWGVRNGALLQTEPNEVPELPDAVEVDVVRDATGRLRLFALDAAGRLFALTQTGAAEHRPAWAAAWTEISTVPEDCEKPRLRHFRAVRTEAGGLGLFAVDAEDRLWAIDEDEDEPDGWAKIEDLGTRAAHFAVGCDAKGRLELFAASRQNQLIWLRRKLDADGGYRWQRRVIEWDADSGERKILNVYRTGLTILNEDDGMVPGVPVYITASKKLASVVNGLSYGLNPSDPVTAKTNAFGKVNVIFEVHGEEAVPSLSFAADFLDGGVLDVNPQRKAQVYVESITREELLCGADAQDKMHLIPENTVIQQP